MSSESEIVPDTQYGALMRALPATLRAFALLARFDRPIGWWLLFWPCAWSVALAGGLRTDWSLVFWMLLGAVAMRGAGCVYNDIVDRDLDRSVARTRSRPLASGAVSVKAAWAWLLLLCLIGLVVLLRLDPVAQVIALASLAPVAAYPFMKRITWWPQAWLGLVFSWGALVGWAAVRGAVELPMLLLYAGSICWVVGYDTLYALQDREDDALIGIRSSARRMGSHVRAGVAGFYIAALAFWATAVWTVRPDWIALLALLPIAAHLIWQVAALDPDDGLDGLIKFRANRFAGFLMFLACAAVGSSG
jgi:4-hydroxybenzoate polyprenyltransferase